MTAPLDLIQAFRKRINAYKHSQIIVASERLGIFKAFGYEARDAKSIAEFVDVSPERLEPLLNALVAIGLVEREGESYALTEEGALLAPDHATSQAEYVRYVAEVMERWRHLAASVADASVAARHFSEITGEDRHTSEAFLKAMDTNAKPQVAFLSREYSFRGHRILDVGAGAGTYSIELGRSYDDANGDVLELPGVAAFTKDYLERAGLKRRFSVIEGDYNSSLPEGPYDDVLLFAVIHQETEEATQSLLRRIHLRLRPGGRLFLTSFFLDDMRCSPMFSVMFAVEMLVMVPTGRVHTHSGIQRLLKGVGFRELQRIDACPGPATLYVAKR